MHATTVLRSGVGHTNGNCVFLYHIVVVVLTVLGKEISFYTQNYLLRSVYHVKLYVSAANGESKTSARGET